jgi:hypothetical protein
MNIDLLGEASLSTLNILRRGDMAPKVESGAFRRFKGWEGGGFGPERRRGAARRTRVPEGRVEQRPGGGIRKGAGSPASQQARGGRGCRCCDRGSGGNGRLAGFGSRIEVPSRCSGHRSTGSTTFHAANSSAGYVPALHTICHTTCHRGGSHDAAVASGNPGTGHDARESDAAGTAAYGRVDRRAERAELLVDSGGRGEPSARPRPEQRRSGPLLAVGRRRQRTSSGPSGRSRPPLRGPGDSSSSALDRDVRSAPLYLAHS